MGKAQQPDVDATAGRGDEMVLRFDITVVTGEAGRRLAALQADVIIDVLTWLHEHHSAERLD